MTELIEYRVRPVTRFIVTRYHNEGFLHDDGNQQAGVVSVRGEYENADTAFEVGTALCKAEHERLGWPLEDERIKYPEYPGFHEQAPSTASTPQGMSMTADTSVLPA